MHCCCRFVFRKVPWQHLKRDKLAYKFKNSNQVLFTGQEANYLHKISQKEWHKPSEVYWPFHTLLWLLKWVIKLKDSKVGMDVIILAHKRSNKQMI